MDFILRKLPRARRVSAQQPERASVPGDGDSNSADDAMLDQQRRLRKPMLTREILEDYGLSRREGEAKLRIRAAVRHGLIEQFILPAHTGPGHHRSSIRLQFQNMTVFNLEGLELQPDGASMTGPY